MARMRRLEKAGAVFTEDLSSVNSVKKRGFAIGGNPAGTNGPIGKALDFDGAADYITLNEEQEKLLRFDGSTQDFSISVWIRRDATGVNHHILNKRDANDDGYMLFIKINNEVEFQLNNIDATSTGTITDTDWHHIVATADRDGNSQVYIDGVADGSGDISAPVSLATTAAPIIGKNITAAGYFNGAIKNLMIFDRLLTQAEVTALATNNPFDYEKNVVSEWDMSDINPADVGYRGNGNDGAQTNMAASNVVNGIAGDKALDFNGSDERVEQDVQLVSAYPFTLSAWAKTTVAHGGIIFGLFDKSSNVVYYNIRTNSDGGFGLTVVNTTTLNVASADTYAPKQWHHIVGVFTSDTSRELFVDGVSAATNNTELGYNTDVDRWVIGRLARLTPANYFNGQIDKAIIFDKALTNLEVADLYEKQRGGRR